MLITLSGLDGAGKSTLAEALKARLDRDGARAVIFHMNKDVGLYAYLRNIRDAISIALPPESSKEVEQRAAKANSGETRSSAEQAWQEVRRRIIWNKSLRKLVDLADLAMFRLYRLYIERLRGRVLIMDRYFYDRLADQADGRRWKYLRWFASIIPGPDLPILVEVTPEDAFGRKGEYSIESMTLRRANYREIFSWVPGSVILPNDNLEATIEVLEQIVRTRLGGSPHHRAAVGG